MQCARASVLIAAAGLFFRFELKLSTFPWVLHRLACEDCPGQDKDMICGELLVARQCDLSLFAKAFRDRFSTLAALRSSEAVAVASLWARGKQFSTKRSELGHAQERQALAAAAAPGRSFVHHVRRDFLRKARALHVGSGGLDPHREGALRQARRSTPEAGPAQLDGMGGVDKMLPPTEAAKLEALCVDFAVPLPDLLSGGPLPLTEQRAEAIEDISLLADRPPGEHSVKRQKLHSGSGGSVYMTYVNEQLRVSKLALGGRSMTPEEVAQVRSQARQEWADMPPAAKGAYRQRVSASVRRRQTGDPAASSSSVEVRYRASLFNSDKSFVAPPKRFCQDRQSKSPGVAPIASEAFPSYVVWWLLPESWA